DATPGRPKVCGFGPAGVPGGLFRPRALRPRRAKAPRPTPARGWSVVMPAAGATRTRLESPAAGRGWGQVLRALPNVRRKSNGPIRARVKTPKSLKIQHMPQDSPCESRPRYGLNRRVRVV